MNITPDPKRLPPKLIFEVRTATGTTPDEAASQRWELVTVRGEVDMHTAGQVVDAVQDGCRYRGGRSQRGHVH